ncbi:DnaJ like protein subfamily A member 2 [Strigomonas culicis]|nr:DnaJ like protein subfamily A member 2 [Strigomonas culicis]EPY37199.1 DnaJ like protein subfamily A member 2 [Strigomonas culicis]|eukprot:EPY33884.1 DnaJ like protein subfamily A member 2 [Strigomonas culicis]
MGMMYQQFQTTCDMCHGTGECIAEKDKCPDCSGNKVVEKQTTAEVNVEKGLSNGSKIRLAGQGDMRGNKAFDLVLVVNEEKHARFTRQGPNLLLSVDLTIEEALCGFQTQFEHLDHRQLVLRRPRGEVTRPGEIMCVRGEGMPVVGSPSAFGDLLVAFHVQFPVSLSVHQCEDIAKSLPGPNTSHSTVSEYPCYVSKQELSVVKEEIQKSEEAEEEDGAPNVGCAAQ